MKKKILSVQAFERLSGIDPLERIVITITWDDGTCTTFRGEKSSDVILKALIYVEGEADVAKKAYLKTIQTPNLDGRISSDEYARLEKALREMPTLPPIVWDEPKSDIQRAAVGKIVHYFPTQAEMDTYRVSGPQAAIITRVWPSECVNLKIFMNDGNGDTFRTSVKQRDGSEYQERTWQWPVF